MTFALYPILPSKNTFPAGNDLLPWEISFVRLDHQEGWHMYSIVFIMFVHVYVTSYPFWTMPKALPVWLRCQRWKGPYFLLSTQQFNSGCRLQIILGTDCLIKCVFYSRDAWTSPDQPWMILRGSRHSEHINLIQSQLQPQSNLSELKIVKPTQQQMRTDDSWIMLDP